MASYLDSLADLLRKGSDTLINLPTEAQRFFTNPQAFTEVVTGKNLLPKETGFVAGATGLPPKNPVQGGALNPAAAPYQEGYEQGEPVAIASMAVPAYAGALRAGAPKVYNALENYMVKSGGMIPLEAYHGTPHKIEGAFDIKKMGTGEGNQSYGPGMYFAENPNIAQFYQQALGKWIDRVKIGDTEMSVFDAMSKYADDGVNAAKVLERMKTKGQLTIDQYNNMIKDVVIPEIRTNAKIPQEKWGDVEGLAGNLYKVDIPDEYIPNMLDWDKPLKDQTKILESILSKNSGFTGQTKREIQELVNKNATGGELFELFGKDQKELADELAKLGVPGVRYLDAGSRGVGKGSSNFVVFEPSTVKILEENTKPVSRKALIEKQVKALQNAGE